MSIEENEKRRIIEYIDSLLSQDSEEEGALNERQKEAIRRISEGHNPIRCDPSQSSIFDFTDPNVQRIQQMRLIPGINQRYQEYDGYIIIGPPGTGKTTVIAYGSIKYVLNPPVGHRSTRPNTKIFICSFSNAAVDRIFEKIIDIFENEIGYNRFGAFTRRVIAQRRDMDLIPERQRPFVIRPYADNQSESARHRNILRNTQIFIGTLFSCEMLNHNKIYANHVLFDEGSQITPPLFYYPIARNDNVIRIGLVGDNCQLPPINEISRLSFSGIDYLRGHIEEDFSNSLIGPENQITLNYQYRMHPAIRELAMRFSMEPHRVLLDGPNVLEDGYLLQGFLPLDSTTPHSNELNNIFDPHKTVVVIDTSNLGTLAEDEFDQLSRINLAEIQVIQALLRQLELQYPDLGVNSLNIKIVSPYKAQANRIEEITGILSGTADKFQGQEASIVFLSMTFADFDSPSQFLADLRRLNVALSRAQRKLIIIGNQSMMNHRLFRRIRTDIFGYSYRGPPDLTYIPYYHLNLNRELYNYLIN